VIKSAHPHDAHKTLSATSLFVSNMPLISKVLAAESSEQANYASESSVAEHSAPSEDDDEEYAPAAKTKKRKAPAKSSDKKPVKKPTAAKGKKTSSGKDKTASKGSRNSKKVTKKAAGEGMAKGDPKTNILKGLMELSQFGIEDASRVYTALFAGYKNPRSDGFAKALKALQGEGKIETTKDVVRLTEEGKESAPPIKQTSSNEEALSRLIEIVKMVCGKTASKAEMICQFLGDGNEHTLKSVAMACGYTNVRSEGLTKVLSALKTLKLLDRDSGNLKLAKIAFPHTENGNDSE
jgi:hypothetical protein